MAKLYPRELQLLHPIVLILILWSFYPHLFVKGREIGSELYFNALSQFKC